MVLYNIEYWHFNCDYVINEIIIITTRTISGVNLLIDVKNKFKFKYQLIISEIMLELMGELKWNLCPVKWNMPVHYYSNY